MPRDFSSWIASGGEKVVVCALNDAVAVKLNDGHGSLNRLKRISEAVVLFHQRCHIVRDLDHLRNLAAVVPNRGVSGVQPDGFAVRSFASKLAINKSACRKFLPERRVFRAVHVFCVAKFFVGAVNQTSIAATEHVVIERISGYHHAFCTELRNRLGLVNRFQHIELFSEVQRFRRGFGWFA